MLGKLTFVGGQSVPMFDYGLAPYIDKTLKHHFIDNIVKYLMFTSDNTDSTEKIKEEVIKIYNAISKELDSDLNLSNIHEFCDLLPYETNIKTTIENNTIKETDKDTYQAMEALIHNLNTMNCLHETQEVCVYRPITGIKEFNKLSEAEKEGLKNLIIDLYENKNYTIADIREELNIPKKVLNRLFEIFNIHKRDRKENVEAVKCRMQRLYGVDNKTQLPSVKAKIKATQFRNNGGVYAFNTEKQKQTCLERYGAENPMSRSSNGETLKKAQATNLKKYGTKCSLQNPEVAAKARKTCFKRYGDVYVLGVNSSIADNIRTNNFRNPETLNKALSVLSDKYDGHWGFGDSEIDSKIKATCKERYGYENPALPMMHGKSKWEDIVTAFLKEQFPDIEIQVNKRSLIPDNKRLEVDIYLPEYKFGIEINGAYSHSKDMYLDDMINGTCNSKEMQKSYMLHDEGIKLIHVWEDDLMENESLKLNRILYRLYKWIAMGEED